MAEKNKKRLNTNANGYTLVYSTVNVALDKKKQLLYALNVRNVDNAAAAEKYKQLIVADEIIDVNGKLINKGEPGGEKAGFTLNSADYKAGKLALFVCKVNGQTKYIIPVYGMGLWGPINGFIALNDDKNTVYGAYFNHEGETAGLGAEIKDNIKWQKLFQGKKLFGNDNSKIALSVVKKVEEPATQVDAVTGATLTSNGVSDMLAECLSKYLIFLTDK